MGSLAVPAIASKAKVDHNPSPTAPAGARSSRSQRNMRKILPQMSAGDLLVETSTSSCCFYVWNDTSSTSERFRDIHVLARKALHEVPQAPNLRVSRLRHL